MRHTAFHSWDMTFGKLRGFLEFRELILSSISPDYKKLSILRQLFPRVPILALSATCPPKVLKDLVLTLRLKPVVSGTCK